MERFRPATTTLVGAGGIFNMGADDHMGLKEDSFKMVEILDGGWTVVK